jgi:hypothetical protein
MVNGNILVISRTPWSETPRIRHQLSIMLRDSGFNVCYLETLFQKTLKSEVTDNGIQVFRVYETIHHQLRPLELLFPCNKNAVKKQLNKLFTDIDFVAVFNFNYDYYFIKEVFNAPVISIFNDDFMSAAKPWMKKTVAKTISRTCQESDSILSVSYSLNKQLKQLSDRAELFLPWAVNPYFKPAASKKRNKVLYFGYISRIDIRFIDALCANGISIRFVGPVMGDGIKVKKKYELYDNVEFLSSRPLDDVILDDVCCSIALYNVIDDPSLLAITASNRMFQLLAKGIPLVYPEMPNLIYAPSTVIKSCSSPGEYVDAVRFFETNFYNVQDDIKSFLLDHTVTRRTTFVNDLLNRLINSNN